LKTFIPGLGAHPASYLMGTVALSQAVKWLGLDVDQLPSSRVDNTCTPLYSFMFWTGTTLLLLTSLNLGQDTCDPDWSSFFLPHHQANARFIFQGGYGCFLLLYQITIQHCIVISDPVCIVK